MTLAIDSTEADDGEDPSNHAVNSRLMGSDERGKRMASADQ